MGDWRVYFVVIYGAAVFSAAALGRANSKYRRPAIITCILLVFLLLIVGPALKESSSQLAPKWFDPRRLLTSLSAHGDDFLKNEAVRAVLRKHGDDGKLPRSIDHYAYFPTPEARAGYRELVISRGYQVEREDVSASGDGRLVIIFSKVQAPVAVDQETAFLDDEAGKLGGEYDGWETDNIAKQQ